MRESKRMWTVCSQHCTGFRRIPQQDIQREIRAHIVDSAEHSSDQASAVDRVLTLLGTPEELAARYSTECRLQRASRSFSPWLILRTCWHWTKLGIKETLAFLVALFGYSIALGLTDAIFLKAFMPSKVGMWIGPKGFDIGVPAHPEQMHELLGNDFVPLIAAAAFLSATGTTHLLRWMMRKHAPGLFNLEKSGSLLTISGIHSAVGRESELTSAQAPFDLDTQVGEATASGMVRMVGETKPKHCGWMPASVRINLVAYHFA